MDNWRRIANIVGNSLKRRNFTVMAKKVFLRLKETGSGAESRSSLGWCEPQARPLGTFLGSIDSALWTETQEAGRNIAARANEILASIGVQLSGGGNYLLLYFLTRYLRPDTIVETGVAAGWSSQTLLLALKLNGEGGRLYSSDFPLFRLENPEALIGCIVDKNLKSQWTLLVEGDKYNLPKLLGLCGTVDMFHYDSDKTYAGRKFALDLVMPRLSASGLIIFDDIQDNGHFRDLVAAQEWPYYVFEFEGKYVGLTGPGASSLSPQS